MADPEATKSQNGSGFKKGLQSWVSPGLLTAKAAGEEDPEARARRQQMWLPFRVLLWEFRMAQGQTWRKGLMKPVGIEYNPKKYFRKWAGKNLLGPPRFLHPWIIFMGVLGAFAGITLLAILQQFAFDDVQKFILVGPFASSSITIAIAPDLPLAQPRNVILGHTFSCIVGVTVRKIVIGNDDITSPPWPRPKPAPPPPPPCKTKEKDKKDKKKEEAPKPAKPKTVDDLTWLAVGLSVSIAALVMCITKTLHPPAASTAMAGVLASALQVHMGYELVPFVMLGAVILVIVALIWNNLFTTARYPQFWW